MPTRRPASLKHFQLQYINYQLVKLKGKSLFEYCLEINARDVYSKPDKELSFEFSGIVFCLLEEFRRIVDIDEQLHLDAILTKSSETDEQSDDQTSGDAKKMRFYQDDLLGMVVAYSSKDDSSYESFKKVLSERNVFFAMLFDILGGNDEKFSKEFMKNLEKFEASCPKRYGSVDSPANLSTNMIFIFLMAALLNDRRKVIERIFEYEDFVSIKIKFPPNIRCNDTCHYVAMKLLENGFELRHKEIPENWITPEIFKHFLDRRISLKNDSIEIDFSFLVHNNTRAYEIKGTKDVDAKLLLFEDWKALQHIYENESLRQFFTHPVLSTYVDLKTMKHQRIRIHILCCLFLVILTLSFLTAFLSMQIKNSEYHPWLLPFPALVFSISAAFMLSGISSRIFLYKSNFLLEIMFLSLVMVSLLTFVAIFMGTPAMPCFLTTLACFAIFFTVLFKFTPLQSASNKRNSTSSNASSLSTQASKARSFVTISKFIFSLYKEYR